MSYCSLTLNEIFREPEALGGFARDIVSDVRRWCRCGEEVAGAVGRRSNTTQAGPCERDATLGGEKRGEDEGEN